MAIFEDDFEGQSVGQQLPFGSWSGFGGIVTTGGPYPSNPNTLLIAPGQAEYTDVATFPYKPLVYFLPWKQLMGTGSYYRCLNGPNAFLNTFEIMQLKVETDGTVSAILLGGTNTFNSYDSLCKFNTFNFFQVNIELADWLDGAIERAQVKCHVALNGKEIISTTYNSPIAASQFVNGTTEVNRFALKSSRALYDNFTLDNLQPIITFPHPGSPKAINASQIIEIPREPDSANVDFYNSVVELGREPDSAKIIFYQGVIELLLLRNATTGLWKVREM